MFDYIYVFIYIKYMCVYIYIYIYIVLNYFPFLFSFFRATPVAYGSSQVRGQVRAAIASLHHSHSNTGSKLRLGRMPELAAMLDT